jgi:hypothetical protein
MAYVLPERDGNPFWPMPSNYGRLRESTKLDRRLELLGAWYDPNDYGRLMSSAEVFLAALYFFVEHYVKRSEKSKHFYHWPDCRLKPVMQRMFTYARGALVAPRGSSKTFTVVFEMVPFIAVTRPNTGILLGSETKDLTKEKIKNIRRRIETNERILRDFGQVWPTGRGADDWSNTDLDFVNGSSIKGSSIDMATRGRHPLVGVIDDPEGKRSGSPAWREQFMEWLFHTYLNQFHDHGTHVMWIGTILRSDSCLWRAIHNEDEEGRFSNWTRRIIKMVYEDPPESGNYVSAWPEKLSVEEFEAKKSGSSAPGPDSQSGVTVVGLAAVMAEFQGEPIPMGQKMFHRDERRHGYVMGLDSNKHRYIYDPALGKSWLYREYRRNCFMLGGVDIADTPSRGADPSAIVIAMLDPDGVFWILDAWEKRCFSDETALEAMRMSHRWRVDLMAWEQASLAKRIFREAKKLRIQREDQGFHVPVLKAVDTQGVPKPQRIERMRPDFDAARIKLPILHEIDGHHPYKRVNTRALHQLLDQIDTMTGEGTAGHDDLLDALEMLHRSAVRRPKVKTPAKTRGRKLLEKWEKEGLFVDPMEAHPNNWTPRMRKQFEERVLPTEGRDEYHIAEAFV